MFESQIIRITYWIKAYADDLSLIEQKNPS